MNHPLDGAKFKVVRAQEHLDTLKNEIRGYLDGGNYKITFKPNAKGHPEPYPVSTVEPPLRLNAVVGDVMTNVRASLDYIIWQLGIAHFQNPPLIPDEDKKWASFPIYNDPSSDGLANKINRFTNRQVPTSAVDEIKALQPYNRPYRSLWWLH